MSKYVDMIGMMDAPHLNPPNLSEEAINEILAGMLPHEQQARRDGRPSLGAGAVYPIAEDRIFVEPFKIPDHWARAYALDVGWNRTAALFGAWDEDADIVYLTAEYYVSQANPIEHAHAMKSMMAWPRMQGAIDPAAEHSNQRDGHKLKEEYEELGLELMFANNRVSAGVHRVLTLMQGGGLKVFDTLTYWRKEFRLYRRNEKGKIVKENDHLMDDTRYLVLTDDLFQTRPIQEARRAGKGEW